MVNQREKINSRHLGAYIKNHAETNPSGIAIKTDDRVLSWEELECESNRIANFFDEKIFRDADAGGENFNVCVILDRSAEIITTIIGLLKAGLVFVPVSPHIPEKRVELLLEESKTRWIITSMKYHKQFQDLFKNKTQWNILLSDGEPGPGLPPGAHALDDNHGNDELGFQMRYNKYCYIYFTSGSTGIPKGVLGRHKSLHHYIDWEINEFGIDSGHQVSQLTPPTFDPYLRDIFVPLMAGGTICIPGHDTLMNPVQLITWINENKINLIHIVPSLFKVISHEIRGPDNFPHLKYILLAGELLRGNDIRRFIEIFKDRIQLVNIYGPTETTLAKFFYRVQPPDIEKPVIPVGRTIPGAEALVLDEQGQKCLTGNIGEIYIRTPYISSGYFNNKELNKQVFLKNPFSGDKNDIIYKTGDMGRLLFDGNIELTGRLDEQVKIRGHRVELGEIENHLLAFDYIKEAAVVDKEDKNGQKYLCAFLVWEDSRNRGNLPDTNELKTLLSHHLPAYTLPSHLITLAAMPLNPNGKINRDALRKLDIKVDSGQKYIAPKNELEKKIAQTWKDVLKLDKIGMNDNFFDIGGTSLNAIQVNGKISEMLGSDIPIVKFFEFPTIGSYVKFLESNSSPKPDQEENSLKRMELMTRKRTGMTLKKQKLKELRNA